MKRFFNIILNIRINSIILILLFALQTSLGTYIYFEQKKLEVKYFEEFSSVRKAKAPIIPLIEEKQDAPVALQEKAAKPINENHIILNTEDEDFNFEKY